MLTHRLSRAHRVLLRIAATAALAAPLVWITPAESHDFKLGSIRIDHPYSTPTPPGAQTGAVYFRTLINRGRTSDRLIEARTSVAGRVELHRMRMD
jgi:copper(I)-binding protein